MTTNRTEKSTLTQRESASVVVYLAGSMEKQPQLHSFAGCPTNIDWSAGP